MDVHETRVTSGRTQKFQPLLLCLRQNGCPRSMPAGPRATTSRVVELHELAAELATNPRLAQMHDRIQSLDAAIARATVDVPGAEGLPAAPDGQFGGGGCCSGRQETAAVLVSPGLVTPASIASPESSGRTLPSGRWPTGRILAYGELAASVAAAAIYLGRPAPSQKTPTRSCSSRWNFTSRPRTRPHRRLILSALYRSAAVGMRIIR